MRKTVQATIEDGDKTWLVVSMQMDAGDAWKAPIEGTLHSRGFTDASDHFGIYVSGEFETKYPTLAPVRISGFSLSPIRELTGDKVKYPKGNLTVKCLEPGELLWVVPRGEKVSLDYVVLEPGESVELAGNGWALSFDARDPQPVKGSVQGVAGRVLVFWVAE